MEKQQKGKVSAQQAVRTTHYELTDCRDIQSP